MAEYLYKGFNIHFAVKKIENGLYQANGYVACYMNGDTPSLSKKFCTEDASKLAAETDIKTLIEKYIDFEWDAYLESDGYPSNAPAFNLNNKETSCLHEHPQEPIDDNDGG